jgi:phosphate starvation-inducible PhoH-like protein
MAKQRRPIKKDEFEEFPVQPKLFKKHFHMEFLNVAQKMAFSAFEQHDVLFLLGPAGTGKTHLACAFAINEIQARRKKRIIITRPIVESGERLGFLPGTFEEKVHPYMMPIYDCVGKLVGYDGPEREKIDKVLEKAPLAYLRGRTFDNAVAVFDEAQNASYMQLKLFLTRMGENCKVIITGDPRQSDIPGPVDLVEVVKRLESVNGIGIIEFKANSIVRHPLVGSIIEKLEDKD